MKTKNYVKLLSAFFLIICLINCSFDKIEENLEIKNNAEQMEFLALLKASGNFKVSQENLLSQITQIINEQESSDRSIVVDNKTFITDIKTLPFLRKNISNEASSTRSIAENDEEETFTEIYLISTEDTNGTEGYVIASDDMRIGIVLAIVDGGSYEDEPDWWKDIISDGIEFHIDSTIELYENLSNEKIAEIFDENGKEFNNRSLTGYGVKTGLNGKGLVHSSNPNAPNVIKAEWVWTGGYTARPSPNPDINPNWQPNWWQEEPYNYYVNYYKGGNYFYNDYINGCGPVAMAHLMAKWERPLVSVDGNNYVYQWSQMKNNPISLSSTVQELWISRI